ncbi:MAG: hypothetical protein M0Q14_02860 [Tissierellaceae bacterium]|nr:hypothetical protein [Tissierellaceae bacterium]
MSYNENQKEIKFTKYAYDSKDILEQFIVDATTGENINLPEGVHKVNP